MIKVKVKFFAGIKKDIGLEEIELELEEDSNIENVIELLILKFKSKARHALITVDEKSYKFIIFINNKKISNLEEVRIGDGDSIYFISPVAGG